MILRNATTFTKSVFLLGVIMLLIGVVLAANWLGHSQLLIKATTHQPERFTELYFTNPNSLPTTAASQKSLAFSFTIRNAEARDMTYTYKAVFTAPSGQTTILDRRQLSLPAGETTRIAAATTLPNFAGRGEVSVMLLNQPEAIHFWLVGAS